MSEETTENRIKIPKSHSKHLVEMLTVLQDEWEKSHETPAEFDSAFIENLSKRYESLDKTKIWFKMNLGPIVWFDLHFDGSNSTPTELAEAVLKSLDYTFNPDIKYQYMLKSVRNHSKEFLLKYGKENKGIRRRFKKFLNDLFQNKRYSLLICFEEDKKKWDEFSKKRESYDEKFKLNPTKEVEIVNLNKEENEKSDCHSS